MKILCISPYYKPAIIYGGPSRSVPTLCEAINKCGAEIIVFTTNANGPRALLDVPTDRSIIVDGVEVYYFPINYYGSKIHPFYSRDLQKACFDWMNRFDLIYIVGNWTYPVFVGANSAIRKQIPYVISPRGSFMSWSMGEKSLKKRIYLELFERRIVNHASAVQVSSLLEKKQLNKWNFKSPVFCIPNGFDKSFIGHPMERGKLRDLLCVPPTGTISLFVGRLHKEKRLDLIIQSFAVAARQLPEAHLLIVGADQDGSGHTAMELVSQLGLNQRVHFMGHLSGNDLYQAYIDADVFILLSHRESFGMVAVEAMANGLPLILAEEVGLAEEVNQAQAGLKVKAEPQNVGQAWVQLLIHPTLRDEMGKRGKKLVQERFTSDKVANEMLHLFSTILDKNA